MIFGGVSKNHWGGCWDAVQPCRELSMKAVEEALFEGLRTGLGRRLVRTGPRNQTRLLSEHDGKGVQIQARLLPNFVRCKFEGWWFRALEPRRGFPNLCPELMALILDSVCLAYNREPQNSDSKSSQLLPTLGPEVCKCGLLWAIWRDSEQPSKKSRIQKKIPHHPRSL